MINYLYEFLPILICIIFLTIFTIAIRHLVKKFDEDMIKFKSQYSYYEQKMEYFDKMFNMINLILIALLILFVFWIISIFDSNFIFLYILFLFILTLIEIANYIIYGEFIFYYLPLMRGIEIISFIIIMVSD